MSLKYLMSKHPKIRERMYPKEKKEQIDIVLDWYQCVMRLCSTKLIKMCLGPKAFGQAPYAQEEIRKVQDEFFKVIVPAMNAGVRQEYFCGDDVTAADVILYFELNTILILYKKQLICEETPDLFAWHKRMGNMQEIVSMAQHENKLRNI